MDLPFKTPKKEIVLALGPESSGNFSVYKDGIITLNSDLGDLLDEQIFVQYKKTVLSYLKKNKIVPDIIVTDLHPLYRTTLWGAELSQKFGARHEHVQHHLAHIFSAISEHGAGTIPPVCYGIACDGTGFGFDENIWGGEIFEITTVRGKTSAQRIGHLENQILIGGDLAIREPARMLISILNTFLKKEEVFEYVKKYYNKNQFELLYNQLQQNFNCIQTSSTGRILDAVSILLGFVDNTRSYKHAPIAALEKNSSTPYTLKPEIEKNGEIYILKTTPLFKYLVKDLGEDKARLAATAQMYLAQGLYEILKKNEDMYFAGGIADNKIISEYMGKKAVYMNKKIPRGDAGLSFGQVVYYLLSN